MDKIAPFINISIYKMPRSKSLPVGIRQVLDASHAKKMARGYDLKVTLRKNYKGYSLFAKDLIRKGNVIAYYKFAVFKYVENFVGRKNDMYAMSVYTQKERLNPRLIGDIFEGSLEPPKHGIPYWAYFSNEPSGKQQENAHLDINTSYNYRNRSRVKPGDTMVYKLRASRDIMPGEEITWCYGGAYGRDYKANCDD